MIADTLRLLALFAYCALLSACAGGLLQRDEAREVAFLMANYDRVAALAVDEQKREFSAALNAHEKSADEQTRFNLALMYLLPRAPWRDDRKLITLLEGVAPAKAASHSARHDFAQLLIYLIGERQRIERDDLRKLELLNQQLRDERRKADDARTKSDEATKKLESLRAIDRDLRSRKKLP